MSDRTRVILALITAFSSIVTAGMGVYIAAVSARTSGTIYLLEKNTNSIKDALVKVTAESEFAKGKKENADAEFAKGKKVGAADAKTGAK